MPRGPRVRRVWGARPGRGPQASQERPGQADGATRRAARGRDGLVTLELQTGIVQRQAEERAGRPLV